MPADFEFSVEEIIATLKRSSLPTLVIEGTDDIIVYRRLEHRIENTGLDVLPTGGRDKVLEVFLRRNELASSSRVLFLADQDLWSLIGVPPEFDSDRLILTEGYSIENDVVRDTAKRLMHKDELASFEVEAELFVEWYALAISRHLEDPTSKFRNHPDEVLKPDRRPQLLALKEGERYPHELRTLISSDYERLVRGKSLLNLAIRQLGKSRCPSHNAKSLLEFHAISESPSLRRLVASVHRALGDT